ncbi:hypothetical protein WG66_011018 [Moniliophthora roreri]|nr:hypothetical protein WG66_011018 [Moniliophthora roreri]
MYIPECDSAMKPYRESEKNSMDGVPFASKQHQSIEYIPGYDCIEGAENGLWYHSSLLCPDPPQFLVNQVLSDDDNDEFEVVIYDATDALSEKPALIQQQNEEHNQYWRLHRPANLMLAFLYVNLGNDLYARPSKKRRGMFPVECTGTPHYGGRTW